jgi:exodeoxyribonuclease V alpha subunit
MDKITVLTPYNKDIEEINKYSQSIYLKDIDVYQYGQRGFILGDRMMQTTNVYNQEHGEVMNGEEGIITNISSENLTIVFNKQKTISYKWDDNKKLKPDFLEQNNYEEEENSEKDYLTCDLKHSFCKTVHKSQGSEYDYVIIYLPPTKGSFVNINLLYTAITRTKKTVWLVVDKESLEKASRTKLTFRYDRLAERIQELFN